MIRVTLRKPNGPSYKIKQVQLDNKSYYVIVSNILSSDVSVTPIFDTLMDAINYAYRFFDDHSKVVIEIHK